MSCSPLDLFSEFNDVNLINSFQFGEELVAATSGDGWEADKSWDDAAQTTETLSNSFMLFEPLDGTTTPTLADAVGLYNGLPSSAPDGDSIQVYRLEVKNQFSNGDFETGALGGNWATTGTGTASVIDNSGDYVLDYDNLNALSSLSVDLASQVDDWSAGETYAYHMEFILQNEKSNYFFVSNSSVESILDSKYRVEIPAGSVGEVANFPSKELNSDNYFIAEENDEAGNPHDSLYFGSNTEEGYRFQAYIDDVRVVSLTQGHSVRLQVPFSNDDRPDLEAGGTLRFSVYILADPTVSSTNNRFNAQYITLGVQGLYEDGSGTGSAYQAIATGIPSNWTKVSMDASNIIKSTPSSGNPSMIELSITAGALPEAWDEDHILSSYSLDAGSILVALPELYWSEN